VVLIKSKTKTQPMETSVKYRLLIFSILSVVIPMEAVSQIEVNRHRTFELSSEFPVKNAKVKKQGEMTFAFATKQTSADATCHIVRAGTDETNAFTFDYGQSPTRCIGVEPGADGSMYIRGNRPSSDELKLTGFTVKLNASGQIEWDIADKKLVDARDEPGGPGSFLGQYGRPMRDLSLAVDENQLIGFTIGEVSAANTTNPVTQAHVVQTETGRLITNGQRFGERFGQLGGVSTLSSSGDFFLYLFDRAEQGAYFYSYDGGSNIDAVEPLGRSWAEDYVVRASPQGEDSLYLLWTETRGQSAATLFAKTNQTGTKIWRKSWQSQISPDLTLGAPRDFRVGESTAYILYQASNGLYLRAVDTETGESLGIEQLEGLIDPQPLSIVEAGGDVFLIGVAQEDRRLVEFTVSADREAPPSLADGAEAAERVDTMSSTSDTSSSGTPNEQGCGCAHGGEQAPFQKGLYLIGLIAAARLTIRPLSDIARKFVS
jgi:hypothetical protein